MKEIAKKEVTDKKIDLRKLDDIDCSNVVVERQIRRMLSKFPSMADNMAVDCWTHGGHYTNFTFKGGKFIWKAEDKSHCLKGCEILTDDNEDLYSDELNKLLVYTYRTMCDSQNCVDLVDTPEDLLAFAETKLQEMLRDENTIYADDTVHKDFTVLSDSTEVNPERTSNGADSQL